MKVLHLAAELAPIAKIGGLADVTLGLPLELGKKGLDTCVLIPKYDVIDKKGLKGLKKLSSFKVLFDNQWHKNTLWQAHIGSLKVWLIEEHTQKRYFRRKAIYGCSDDMERFLYFCACSYALFERYKPDVVHMHDWHTAAIAPMLSFAKSPIQTIFTIHNPAYQGICTKALFKKLNTLKSTKEWSCGLTKINLLKAGIIYSDFVTTVSPRFARDMLSKKSTWGLFALLKKKGAHYSGILNGIDYHTWDPEKDPYIKARFNVGKITRIFGRAKTAFAKIKQKNKLDLQKTLHLESNAKVPLIACITRLVEQKGLGLIEHAIEYTLKKGGQFVLLGSRASKETERDFEELKKQLKPTNRAHLQFHHNEEIAHKIFAGSDMFIIPSLFEPCGITQMIAMRFGTIPIVRNTGGLADSVFDLKDSSKKPSKRNGFTFSKPTKASIEEAIDRALLCWEKRPTEWGRLVNNALKAPYDWEKSAEDYYKIYKKKP